MHMPGILAILKELHPGISRKLYSDLEGKFSDSTMKTVYRHTSVYCDSLYCVLQILSFFFFFLTS